MAELNARINEQQMLLNSYIKEFNCNGFVNGFLHSAVGRKVVITYPSSTTELYSFQQGSTVLIQITVTYSDATKASVTNVERTA